MLKILLDTNCLMVAAPQRSKYHWFYELLKQGEVRLAVSTEILTEYDELLASFYSPTFSENVLRTLINIPELEEVTVYYKWNLIHHDPDDNKFVDAAISCNADFIITHDGDFKALDKVAFPKVRYISLQEFHVQFFGTPMPG
ncbi:MAG: putative toxin-antitoxin system toxin component, PIN family [Saprospiraceae bacterium]|nr:putative toxin-antitoxin system toxin component, PIN family [Saprospiraceae bacterium]